MIAENMLLTTDSSGSVTLNVAARLSAVHALSLTAVTGSPKVPVMTNGTPATLQFVIYSGTSPLASTTFNARVLIVGV